MASCAMAKGDCGHIIPSFNIPNVCFVDYPACMSAHTEISCCRSSSSSAGDSAILCGILRGTLISVLLTSEIFLLPVALHSGEGSESITRMTKIGRNQVPGTHPLIPVGVRGGG